MIRTGLFVLLLCVPLFATGQQPNILWITIEDTSPHFIGCYGDSAARTPVIDSLARAGVRFTNAFSTGTVCSPSRSTLITGVRTYELGTGHHRSQFPVPDFVKGFSYYLKDQGYYVTNNAKTDYNLAGEQAFIEEAWHERSAKAGWWNRGEGQPFFSIVNFEDAHQSRTMTHPYEWYEQNVLAPLPDQERIHDDAFAMPPFYRDSPEMRKEFARVYNSLRLTDIRIGQLLNRLKRDGLLDSTIIFLYADHGEGMPRFKTNGISMGYRVPFIICVPPMYRHLSPWGTGAVSDELVSFEDLAPTVISLAGGEVPAHMKGRILMGERRQPAPKLLFLSSDRSDNGIDMVRNVTDGRYFYSRNFMPYLPELRYIRYMEISAIKQIMRADYAAGLLDPVQRSPFAPRKEETLYDVAADPWEIRNMANAPAASTILNGLRAALREHMRESRDVMLLPEHILASQSADAPPYIFRQDEKILRTEDVLDAAWQSGIRGRGAAKQQAARLSDDDKAVRYWAATGLRSQDREVLRPLRRQILRALRDADPGVAIVAAAIAYDTFDDSNAQEVLERFAGSDDRTLALLSFHFLTYVDKPGPFLEVAKKVAGDDAVSYDVSAAAKDFLGKHGIIPNNFENR